MLIVPILIKLRQVREGLGQVPETRPLPDRPLRLLRV